MDPALAHFLSARTEARPEARVGLHTLHREFLRSLADDRQRSLWPRWRFLAEIERKFIVGTDEHGVASVGGVSLIPAVPRRWTRDDAGRLRLTEVA